MSLILKQELSATVPTPPSGKGTIFLNENDQVGVKSSDGSTSTFPTISTSNTQVFYNDTGSLAGSNAFVFNEVSNTVTVENLTVTATLVAGDIAVSSIANGTSNVDIVGVSGNVTISVAGTANVFSALPSGVEIANALTVYGNASVGNLSTYGQVDVTGNVIASYFVGNGSQLTGIDATAIQNGVASVRTYSTGGNVAISANGTSNVFLATDVGISIAGEVNATGNVSGQYFIGNGSQLTGIDATSIQNGTSNVKVYNNGNVATSVGGTSNVAITTSTGVNVAGTLNATGNANVGNIGATGGVFTTVAGSLTTASQPNITSVGTLTSLGVNGTITGVNITANTGVFTGNGSGLTDLTGANVTGAVAYATTANAVAGANVSGEVSYAATANSVAGANVSGAVAYATTANAVAGANVSGAVAYATTANAVAGANVSGAVGLATYATTANAVAGANVSGAVAYATTANAVAGANVSGEVSYANVANNVAVANVTGIGNIATLNIDGNSSNILYGNGTFASAPVTYGNSNVATFLASFGSNTIYTTGNVDVGNLNATDVYTNTLDIATSANLGAVNNLTITGGSDGYALTTDGTGNLAWTSITTSIIVDEFTGDGSTTNYTLSVSPATEDYTIVGVAGTMQPKISYSVSGNVITFSSAPPSGSPIEVTTFTSTAIGAPAPSNNAGLTWNIVGANAQMLAFNGYFVDSSAGALFVTLPASGTLGDTIKINDLAGDAGANNITVLRNGHNIQGAASDLLIDYNNATVELVYSNSTYGWKAIGL